jgi:hypothetical protein
VPHQACGACARYAIRYRAEVYNVVLYVMDLIGFVTVSKVLFMAADDADYVYRPAHDDEIQQLCRLVATIVQALKDCTAEHALMCRSQAAMFAHMLQHDY